MSEAAPASDEHFIPISRKRLLQQLLVDTSEESQREAFERLAEILSALVHFETHALSERIRTLYLPVSPESLDLESYVDDAGESRITSTERLDRLREEVQNLLAKANFREISDEDLEFALQDTHVFDLPIEIDWEAFDGDPLIYVRGATHDTLEGRFFFRKLPGYLLRGTLGNVVIGVLLLLIGLGIWTAAESKGTLTQLSFGPALEEEATLGPSSSTVLQLHDGLIESAVTWNLTIVTEDDERIPLFRSPEYGSISIESGRIAHFHSPRQLPSANYDVIVEAQYFDDESGDEIALRRSFSVAGNYEPTPLRGPARYIGIVLIVLGVGGVMVGFMNGLRRIRLDDERRRLQLEGKIVALREMTRERNRALRIDRFKDLWRYETIRGEMFRQVVLFFKLKDSDHVMLKLFKDIPLADLELIFPNTRPRMHLKDRLMLIFSFIAAGIVIAIKVITIVATAVITFGLGTIIALLSAGGIASRTWAKFKRLVSRYTTVLTESLYYKNLDNNFGVIHFLIDGVEQQEVKEALLAFAILSRDSAWLAEAELDNRTEAWLKDRFDVDCDFECDDALSKLENWQLVEVNGAGPGKRYRAIAINDALQRIDERWDRAFEYA